ncbi:MAG: trypsin-like serine protease [Oligoflexia bacterium]|nr:trypsin-like serine protease [Oligoflexia bacterium]
MKLRMLLRIFFSLVLYCSLLVTSFLSFSISSYSYNFYNKIIGGIVVPSSQWKSAVALTDTRTGKMFCSGTLLTKELVVTAAHCLKSESFKNEEERIKYIRVYTGNGVEGGEFVGQYRVKIARFHEKYCIYDNAWADIAILVLENPVSREISDTDLPPILSDLEEMANNLIVGRSVKLVGFGERNFINLADFNDNRGGDTDNIRSNNKALSGIKYEVTVPIKYVSDKELIWDGSYSRGHYYGDSGGPVYIKLTNNTWKLVAIISRGYISTMEGIDILLANHICWIQKNSGILIPNIRNNCL